MRARSRVQSAMVDAEIEAIQASLRGNRTAATQLSQELLALGGMGSPYEAAR